METLAGFLPDSCSGIVLSKVHSAPRVATSLGTCRNWEYFARSLTANVADYTYLPILSEGTGPIR